MIRTKTRLDNYAAVVQARAEEVDLKEKGKPYSEAVIEAAEIWLRLNPVPPFVFTPEN